MSGVPNLADIEHWLTEQQHPAVQPDVQVGVSADEVSCGEA